MSGNRLQDKFAPPWKCELNEVVIPCVLMSDELIRTQGSELGPLKNHRFEFPRSATPATADLEAHPQELIPIPNGAPFPFSTE